LIFKPLAPTEEPSEPAELDRSCSSVDVDKGAWPNQEPLSLSPRLFFLSSPRPFLFLFFGPDFFVDFTQGLLSVLDFSMKLERAMHKENMQIT